MLLLRLGPSDSLDVVLLLLGVAVGVAGVATLAADSAALLLHLGNFAYSLIYTSLQIANMAVYNFESA